MTSSSRAHALAALDRLVGKAHASVNVRGRTDDEVEADHKEIRDDHTEVHSAFSAPVEPAGTPRPSRAEVEAALNRVADVVVTTWPKDEHVTLVETMDREALRTLRRALAARAAQEGGA